MVNFKQPITPASSATDSMVTLCTVQNVDLTKMVASVIDQLGNPRQVSLKVLPGKQVAYPTAGETWVISREYGDWMFVGAVNVPLVTGGRLPTGGSALSVLAKASLTDYDVQWLNSDTAGTVSTVVRRDAAGRTQMVDPSAAQDVSTKNYVDVTAGTSAATASALVRRDASSRTQFADPSAAQDAATKNYVDVSMPTGVVMPFAGSAAPSGYLLCDGSAVNRTTYATLFALISTTYGVGNGSTTFNVPNLLGRAPVGYDGSQTEFNAVGKTGGEKTHQLVTAEMPSHTHIQNAHSHNVDTAVTGGNHWQALESSVGDGTNTNHRSHLAGSVTESLFAANAVATNQTTGGDGAHNNLQPYISLNYIIKT